MRVKRAGMQKVSAQQVRQVLAHVPEAMRKLAEERDYWRKEAQIHTQRDEAEKVARAMHEKGIEQHVPFDDLVCRMQKAAEVGKLQDIERAVDMVGPDMGTKIAQLTDDEHVHAGATDPLTRYLLGGIG